MNAQEAQSLLDVQRAEIEAQLRSARADGSEDRAAERETGDIADPAQSLTAEGVDDAVAAGLAERLAAIGRAEDRLAKGTYGLSVRSGEPIPDERLRAYPSAELTVAEGEADSAQNRA